MNNKKKKRFEFSELKSNSRDWNLESIVLIFMSLANSLTLALSLILSSYFTFNLLETISYKAQDGWCLEEKAGFGVHCFGDFGFPITQLLSTNDVYNLTPPSNYTPWVTIIFSIFKGIYLTYGWNMAIVLYSLLLVIPIWITIIDALRNVQLKIRIGLTICLGLFSPALLMIIDRGNSVGLIVLPLYMFFKKFQNNSDLYPIFWGVVAIAIRPQSCIILIFLFICRRYSEFFRIIIASSFIYLLGFYLLSSKNFMGNLTGFLNSLIGYSQLNLGGIWPYNYSIANAFGVLNRYASLGLDNSVLSLLGTLVSLLFILVVGLVSKYSSLSLATKQSTIFIWLLPFGFLLPSVSYGYYTCFGLLAMLILVREKLTPQQLGFGNLTIGFVFLSVLSLTLTLVFVPASLLYPDTKANLLQVANPGLWIITYSCLSIRLLFLLKDLRSRRNRTKLKAKLT